MNVLPLKSETYHLHGAEIAPADLEELEAYGSQRRFPRPFLYYLLANDLVKAVSAAGPALPHLPAYVSYLYCVAPLDSWGSYDQVRAWLNPRPSALLPRRRYEVET